MQKLSEKCEVQTRSLMALEERCGSLKATIDQLNHSLERAAASEGELRQENQSLQRTLLDTSHTSQSSTEKLKHVSNLNFVSEFMILLLLSRIEFNN